MTEWLPLIALVLGFLLRGEFERFTDRARLADRIERGLAVYQKLPEGAASREELLSQIELQVRYLIANNDRPTTSERLRLRRDLLIITLPVLVIVSVEGVLYFSDLRGGLEGWRLAILVVVALVGRVVGGRLVLRQRSSVHRRWMKLRSVERDEIVRQLEQKTGLGRDEILRQLKKKEKGIGPEEFIRQVKEENGAA